MSASVASKESGASKGDDLKCKVSEISVRTQMVGYDRASPRKMLATAF